MMLLQINHIKPQTFVHFWASTFMVTYCNNFFSVVTNLALQLDKYMLELHKKRLYLILTKHFFGANKVQI